MRSIFKIITVVSGIAVIAFILFFAFTFFMLFWAFRGYDGGIGIDHNNAYYNKEFDNYRLELQGANKKFLESDDPYFFFEVDLKEHIVGICVDRYFKDHNITDAHGWRFGSNISTKFSMSNKLYDEKYSKDLRLLENEGYNHVGLQHTWKIDKEVDCNETLNQNLHSYLAKLIFFYSHDYKHKNLQWAEYLRKQIKDDCYIKFNDEPIKCMDYVEKKEEERRIYQEQMKKKVKLRKVINKQNNLWKSAKMGNIYRIGYFDGVDANIKNENGETPLMVAVKNGHDSVVDSMSSAIVDVYMKDDNGKTAFDYIKQPLSQREKIFSDRMYGSLRMLEVAQLINKGKGEIIQSEYSSVTDILKVVIVGGECSDFTFPENTQCKTGQ